MAQKTPSGIVRRASTLSILWGISLIVLGMLALGSPFVAAVAINAFVAWLLVLAGVVHLTVAFHTREAEQLARGALKLAQERVEHFTKEVPAQIRARAQN